MLWVWQGCGFGSVPVAFPLGEKHPSDCAIPFHHGWLLPSDAASPCIYGILGLWYLCRAPALPQAWLWMCSGGLRAVKIKVLRTALRPMVLCQACFWSSQYPRKRYGLLHFSRTRPGGWHLPLVLHCPCPSPTCLPETGLRHVPAPLLHVSSNCHCELRPVTPWAPNASSPPWASRDPALCLDPWAHQPLTQPVQVSLPAG